MASVSLTSVRKDFGPIKVIADVDLAIADGELVVFVGPSGCGKSTLLRLIAGLAPVSSGEIAIDGEVMTEVPASRRGIAIVFQSYALYPHMNVARNIGFALETAGLARRDIRTKVEQVATMLKIGHLLDRRPRELSGGQRQRVAIGRALVRQPKLFLFDEPLSNLDTDLRAEMRIEIARLHDELGTTMIYVTHDQTEAMTLADRIVVLNAGRIEQVGTPQALYATPANRFVAGFIGSPRMNFLPIKAASNGTGWRLTAATLDFQIGPSAAPPALIGVRPEALSIVTPGEISRITGQLVRIEDLGHEHLAHVRLADDLIWTARLGVAMPHLARGDAVGLTWPNSALYLFDAAEQRLSVA